MLYNINASCFSQAWFSLATWLKLNYNTKVGEGSVNKHNKPCHYQANILRKSNVILSLYFGNLR